MGMFGRRSGDDEEPPAEGRRSKAYVRFDQMQKEQTGPMHGPFDALRMENHTLSGVKGSTLIPISWRQPDGKWYLIDAPSEPGYYGFSVVFS